MSEFLRVYARQRTHPQSNDDGGGNWISCDIDVAVGGFRGRVNADLRSEEFLRFRNEARDLYVRLNGTANFSTMEGWLTIRLIGEGRGHIAAECELHDQPGCGNRLTFKLQFDQTYLPDLITGLERIVSEFPVLG